MKTESRSLAVGAALTLAALLAAPSRALAGSPDAAMLSHPCAACHGTHGRSEGPSMPSLAGQPRASLFRAMQDFKNGKRESTIMGRIAKGYSDEDFAKLADFFSAQKLHPAPQSLDAARIERGAALRRTRCKSCHTNDGKDGTEHAPALAGQWLPYLQLQMDLFMARKRPMPDPMAEELAALPSDDLAALLHYYASVK